jgi:hypothetical protein
VVQIVEAYDAYEPPRDTTALVTDLLATVPKARLGGLARVVLTNSTALRGSRKRARSRARGRKVYHATEAAGLYHQEWHGQPAWIEVFVDRVLSGVPGTLARLELVRRSMLGRTLYHELGHHLHKTQRPEHREREAVADEWSRKLMSTHWRDRRPLTVMFLTPLAHVVFRVFGRRYLRPTR